MPLSASTIYQSSDLNRRGRAVLDAARGGLARVRDRDGVSLVMTREERLAELEATSAMMRRLAEAVASFVVLEHAVAHRTDPEPGLPDFGAWTWLRALPREDLAEFVQEVRDALFASCRELSLNPLQDTLDGWKATAEALSDELSRETLLGAPDEEDFVEVERPESREPVEA
ncbi:MAG: DUF6247 family protein [Thermoleophilaceae bacterium]